MRLMVLPIVSWWTWNAPRRFGNKTGEIKNQRKNGDDQDHRIIKIGYNMQKSPEDLIRLAVIQTPEKDHQLMLMRKTQ